MSKILLILQNKRFKIILHVLLIPCLIVTGFYIGKRDQSKFQDKKVIETQGTCESQTKELRDELEAVIDNRAQLLGTSKEVYKREKFAIYSPLLEGKEVEVWNYRYKTKNIVRKRIEIDDYSGIEIWEYASSYNSADGPKNFATFGGYENYLLRATLVDEIKENWEESYKTKNGVEMFYGYEYTPKSIGVVTLSSYHDYFPNFRESKPSLVQIWYSKIDGFPTSKNDSSVLQAKLQLNKIVDTFVFGVPEQGIE